MSEQIETLLKESRTYQPTAKTIAAAYIKEYEAEYNKSIADPETGSTDAASAARAFELAINELMPQLVEWTIAQGNGHWSAPASDKANARE